MDFLLDAINNWLKELLISGITNNLTGLFDLSTKRSRALPPRWV